MDLNIVNDEEKFLAGKLEGYTLKGADNKFDNKGNPLPFPGCTIICNIALNTDLSNEIINFQKKIEHFNPKNHGNLIPEWLDKRIDYVLNLLIEYSKCLRPISKLINRKDFGNGM